MILTHGYPQNMPVWLYSAACDGYFESHDYGQIWKRLVAGLDDYDYLFSLALDSGDPKPLLYLHHKDHIAPISLRMRNHSFTEEHHLLLTMLMLIVTAMIKNES
jgi:hypothetical protein